MIDTARIRSTLPHWLDTCEPATDASINELVAAATFTLPPGYVALLRLTDGGETFLGHDDPDNGSYLVLWPSTDVLALNNEHDVPSHAPDHFAFGTNGGGEIFAFNTRRGDDAVFMLPSIGLSDDAGMLYCDSFATFLSLLPESSE
ncbi:Cell wall assembly and cell proliferation coordinating protein [Rhodopirellula baltica SH28]|uniref:Cell wall assembly and cell proliferation coordinating protein n=2 Tax=Rhodopirellula baltica TaxID=265606 RepID=K5EBA7_RHOBT|nr:Cell wall assembly and cell proliferation coordinating protein [Rhodopirellula baltica SH28]